MNDATGVARDEFYSFRKDWHKQDRTLWKEFDDFTNNLYYYWSILSELGLNPLLLRFEVKFDCGIKQNNQQNYSLMRNYNFS